MPYGLGSLEVQRLLNGRPSLRIPLNHCRRQCCCLVPSQTSISLGTWPRARWPTTKLAPSSSQDWAVDAAAERGRCTAMMAGGSEQSRVKKGLPGNAVASADSGATVVAFARILLCRYWWLLLSLQLA